MPDDDSVRRRPSQMSRRTARCVGSSGLGMVWPCGWRLDGLSKFKRAVDGLPALGTDVVWGWWACASNKWLGCSDRFPETNWPLCL
jgi:hypothetical protein